MHKYCNTHTEEQFGETENAIWIAILLAIINNGEFTLIGSKSELRWWIAGGGVGGRAHRVFEWNGNRVKIEWFIFLTIAPPINAFSMSEYFVYFSPTQSKSTQLQPSHFSRTIAVVVLLHFPPTRIVATCCTKITFNCRRISTGSARKLIKVFPHVVVEFLINNSHHPQLPIALTT